MIKNYLNPTVIAEWCLFVAGLLLLTKGTGPWRLFIIWFSLILCTETFGWYQYDILKVKTNAGPFNILLLIRLSFLLWLFRQAPQMHSAKNILGIFIAVFLCWGLINLFFFQKLHAYNYVTEILGNLLLAAACGYLVYRIIDDDNEQQSLFTQEYFWLAIGVLFSAMGSTVLYIFLEELQEYKNKTGIKVYGYINYTVNILLYSCLLIAFICRRKARS
ncbi:hypothetical protein [Foetidibacter luteolus]|uniref:hypothetical protein n=1 Tax=Foetidibacter luteolus TaxID=2608880 RepID=UPI00129B9BCB|nr:hypothetical protein [Foetidibacter luteolus]